jgi:hypothetical protein
MTWPNYIDNLMNNNNMSSCGILGLDGNQWAVSKDFPVNINFVSILKFLTSIT